MPEEAGTSRRRRSGAADRAPQVGRRKLGRGKSGRTMFLTLDRASIRSLGAWLGRCHATRGTEKESPEDHEPFLAAEPPTQKERP